MNETKVNMNVDLNLTKPVEDAVENVILPPSREVASGITKLISVLTTFIDNATYKYITNSKYKKEQFLKQIAQKYSNIPATDVVEPNINILGNTMDVLKYNLDNDYLVEMYTNIMISDMDKRTKNMCHISFVEILKQLSSYDLKILEAIYKMKEVIPFGKLCIKDSNGKFLGYEFHLPIYLAGINGYNITDYNSFSKSIENLYRLGLIEIRYDEWLNPKTIYDKLVQEAMPACNHILKSINEVDVDACLGCREGLLSINNLGYELMQVCLRDIPGV